MCERAIIQVEDDARDAKRQAAERAVEREARAVARAAETDVAEARGWRRRAASRHEAGEGRRRAEAALGVSPNAASWAWAAQRSERPFPRGIEAVPPAGSAAKDEQEARQPSATSARALRRHERKWRDERRRDEEKEGVVPAEHAARLFAWRGEHFVRGLVKELGRHSIPTKHR